VSSGSRFLLFGREELEVGDDLVGELELDTLIGREERIVPFSLAKKLKNFLSR